MTRDAQWINVPAGSEPVKPAHAYVWIRLAGAWWPGAIHAWFRLPDGWAIRLQYTDPRGSPSAAWGSYVFDEETIRPRHDDARPSED
jgi:hypothetical protein